ncbi:Sua5/YciO/YrdC/YwlC family protein [Brasilonema octagenarum UFV-E1]|uniref:L-threonylcarbamoyladenylate synthase n=1 Tax=Brasilonema sennae CENA114 TaxID=415709 RepID=A0A856MFS1_9CYAN|nr:L-threonylcarbamoyladenylate synthase [Brasilonema sennae]QDL07806.1 Sua5/YciO/YrdC/YwlC family protein [Brasilonema sennae CENA114]QDL14167.1 Sua5/YciO/YrdC/YwlC family protein [Brasilonema octagenarum UFV-E1]
MQVSLDTLILGARAGKLVSFPTDTVPALAAIPEQGELIYAAKQRSRDKPLILMAATAEEIWSFTTGSDQEYEIWHGLAKKYWPGTLTLVLPASKRVPQEIISISDGDCDPHKDKLTPDRTIGIRVPNCRIAQTILAQTGPLVTTSANLSGQPPLQTMAEISAQFPDVLTLAATELKDEVHGDGVPSTVVKWTGNNWQVLRQGATKIEIFS